MAATDTTTGPRSGAPVDGIYRSPLGDNDVPEVLLTELVLRTVAQMPDKAALIDASTGRTLTYARLDDAVRRLAGGLVERGTAPGAVIAIMAANCPEYASTFLGVAHAGLTVTTINPSYTAREVRHQIETSKPTLMVTAAAFLDVARTACADTTVEEIVCLDECDDVACVTDLYGRPIDGPVRVPVDHPVVIPYSSGTTGLSKGVVLTHRNLVVNVLQTIPPLGLVGEDTVIAVLPFFHIYGMQVIMNSTFAVVFAAACARTSGPGH